MAETAHSFPAMAHSRMCQRQSHVVTGHFYFAGVIDILQRWTWAKRFERFWKVRRCARFGFVAPVPTPSRPPPSGRSARERYAIDSVAHRLSL